MKEVLDRLRTASRRLAAARDAEVIEGLARALSLWPGEGGYAARAAHEISRQRGSSEAMVRYGLERMVRTHSRPALWRWLGAAREEARERGGAAVGTRTGPPVVAQILAGNVAGLAIPAALEALLARSAVLLKPSSEEPVTARLFLQGLRKAAPFLAEAVALEEWRGGDEAVEAQVFAGADFVIASGGEELMASLAGRLSRPHSLHGPRFSAAIVGEGWPEASPHWWRAVAREIALWDQEGCLSPRVVLVAGEPELFARRLSRALAFWEKRWPARRKTAGDAAAIHAYRARYEMAVGDAGCVASPGTAWTVVWDGTPSLETGPAYRTVRVTRRPSMVALADILAFHRDQIQGLGLDRLGSQESRWRRLALEAGVPWVGPLTRIQNPAPGWRADGRPGLVDLLMGGAPGVGSGGRKRGKTAPPGA